MQYRLRRLSRTGWMVAAALALGPAAGADTVELKNGDRISGSILQCDGKLLVLKSEYAGEIKIQWAAVTGLQSTDPLVVALKGGEVLVGRVSAAGAGIEVAAEDGGRVSAGRDAVAAIRNRETHAAIVSREERLANPSLFDLWGGYFDTSLAFSAGNSKTSTFGNSVVAARTTPTGKLGFNFLSLYSTNSARGPRETTANLLRGGVRYDLKVSPKWYAFGVSDFEYDEFQQLDLRFAPGAGFGIHVFQRGKNNFLNLYSGGSLNKEYFFDGVRRTSGELLFGNEFQRPLNGAVQLEQKWALYPNVTREGAYRMNFDLGLVTRFAKWLSWQVTLSDRYLSNPAPGRKTNDAVVRTGLRLTFQQ